MKEHELDKMRSADVKKLPTQLFLAYKVNRAFEQGFNVGYDKGFLSGMIHAMKHSGISEDKINEALRGDENERS